MASNQTKKIQESKCTLSSKGDQMKVELSNLLDQVYQMQGMFDDEDQAIANAIKDAEKALSRTPKIIIHVSGGVVQSVYSSEKTEVDILDYDIFEHEEEDYCGRTEEDYEFIIEEAQRTMARV